VVGAEGVARVVEVRHLAQVPIVAGRVGRRGLGGVLFSVQQALYETLAEQGHPRVRPRHGAVLAYLDTEGVRATELSQRSGQHKQVIGTIVDELVEPGYVRREPDPDDRRAELIVPTPLGIDEIAEADAILAAIEQRHRQALGEDNYADFKRKFQQIARLQRTWRRVPSPTSPLTLTVFVAACCHVVRTPRASAAASRERTRNSPAHTDEPREGGSALSGQAGRHMGTRLKGLRT
jgi:DNA-binding MarR family transcriptional regulator